MSTRADELRKIIETARRHSNGAADGWYEVVLRFLDAALAEAFEAGKRERDREIDAVPEPGAWIHGDGKGV